MVSPATQTLVAGPSPQERSCGQLAIQEDPGVSLMLSGGLCLLGCASMRKSLPEAGATTD